MGTWRTWSGWLALSALVGCGEGVQERAEARQAPAALTPPGPAAMVKDLNLTPRNRRLGDFQGVFVHGSRAFLSGALWELSPPRSEFATSLADMELWSTDGTPEGTWVVKDIAPGAEQGSRPWGFTVWKEQLFFLASPPDSPLSLWSTDGTPEGTVLRAHLPVAGVASDRLVPTRHGLCLGLRLYPQGTQLWCKDDSPLGMVRLAGPWDSVPVVSGGSLEWQAVQGDGTALFRFNGQRWLTDGTPEGTRRVEPATGLDALAPATPFTPYQGALYYEGPSPGLWRTDGSGPGTAQVKALPDVGCGMGVAHDTLWLPVLTPTAGERTQLWRSDGTSEGTSLVATLSASEARCTASFRPLDAHTTLFLTRPGPYTSVSEGGELWRTDGTAAGTGRLQTYAVAPAVATLGGVGYVMSVGGISDRVLELSRTDGTPEGTRRVKRVLSTFASLQAINPLRTSDYHFSVLPGRLLFPVGYNPGRGAFQQLFSTDGTAEGTRPVLDTPSTEGSAPSELVAAGSRVYFLGKNPAGMLFTSDGTAEGTVALRPLQVENLNSESSAPPKKPMLTPMPDGRLFFRIEVDATTPDPGLWVSDGTPAGTVRVAPLSPEGLTPLGSTLYFVHGGTALWRSDGTAAGTGEVKRPGASLTHLTAVGPTLYFVHGGTTLWRSDGTPEGTVAVKSLPLAPTHLTASDTLLYFLSGQELWRSDGTPEGTVRLLTASTGATPSHLVAVGSGVAWRQAVPASGGTPAQVELWRSDGTPEGTARVHTAGDLEPLAGLGGTLYFQAEEAQEGWELWRADSGGTQRVKDLMPRRQSGRIVGKVLALREEGKLFFAAVDPSGSVEPWVSDGTRGGTGRVQDVAPGAEASNPSGFVRAGGRVFFSAQDAQHGRELWALPVSARREPLPAELICPASRTVEAASAQGRPVEYPAAFALSADLGTPAVRYSVPSGSTFPVGDTPVTATTAEEGAPSATCRFNVTVALSASAPPPPPEEPEGEGPQPEKGCRIAGEGAPWLALAASAWLARRRRAR